MKPGTAVASVAAFFLVIPLFLMSSMNNPSALQAATASSGSLNTGLVPPQFLAFVQRAGAMCPDESPALIAAQIEAESQWNPRAVSPVGAQGIAQFMPGTWAMYGKDYSGDGVADPFDPADAIPAQGALMCELFSQVRSAALTGKLTRGTSEQNALAGYNAGLGNVFPAGGFPIGITETDAYVPRILALKAKYTTATGGGSVPVSGDWAPPMPAGSYRLTSPFGMRFHPIHHEWRLHGGQDFGAPMGAQLYSSCTGKVVSTQYSGGGGNVTRLDCGGGIALEYKHQSAFGVTAGAAVRAGAPIGRLGNTGDSTGPHLHFVVEVGGKPIDPVPFFAAKGIRL